MCNILAPFTNLLVNNSYFSALKNLYQNKKSVKNKTIISVFVREILSLTYNLSKKSFTLRAHLASVK